MIFDHGERISAAFAIVVPRMVEVESRAVIDEPKSSVPHQHVRITRCTVDVDRSRLRITSA